MRYRHHPHVCHFTDILQFIVHVESQNLHTVLKATAVSGAVDPWRLELLLEAEVIESMDFFCLVGVYLW